MKIAGVAIAAAAMLVAVGPCNAGELTAITFGRADQEALNKAYFKPFQQQTHETVRSLSYDGQTTELERMVKSGKVTWDLMQVESRTLQLGCQEGLFERLDLGKLPPRDRFIPAAVSECGLGIFAWAVGLAYDPDKLKQAPQSWSDLWDLERFPGKRGLRRSAKYTLEIALLADGVAPKDVYAVLATKAGVDRAFHKLDQIKDSVVWWQAAPDPALFMSRDVFSMTAAYTLWIENEKPRRNFRVAWNSPLYDVDSWAIPKGSPNAATAYKLMAFASDAERQKAFSTELPYGPVAKGAAALLPDKLKDEVPTSAQAMKSALKIDTDFWIRDGAALEDRFDRWAPPICVQEIEDHGDDYQDQPVCQDAQGNLRTRPVASRANEKGNISREHYGHKHAH